MNSKHSAKEAREKLNNIIDNQLPKFAKMYFDYYMDKKQPRTLYCYALDLVVFFTYVESIGIKLSKAYDMGKITAEIIENYLQHISYRSMGNTQVRRSDATIYYHSSLILLKSIVLPTFFQIIKRKTIFITDRMQYMIIDFIAASPSLM